MIWKKKVKLLPLSKGRMREGPHPKCDVCNSYLFCFGVAMDPHWYCCTCCSSYDMEGIKMVKKKLLGKSWWKSKTLWFNLVLLLAFLFTELGDLLGAGGVVTVEFVLNVMLRFVTSEKLR